MKRSRIFAAGVRWFLSLLAAAVLSACTTVKGSWYFQERGARQSINCPDSAKGCLLLALNNDGRKAIDVGRIDVYGSQRTPFSWFAKATPIWRCEVNWRLQPSMILVLRLPNSSAGSGCRIPVDAVLTTDAKKRVEVRLSSTMPNALPVAWLDCPDPGVVHDSFRSGFEIEWVASCWACASADCLRY